MVGGCCGISPAHIAALATTFRQAGGSAGKGTVRAHTEAQATDGDSIFLVSATGAAAEMTDEKHKESREQLQDEVKGLR